MKHLCLYVLLTISLISSSQQNLLPIHSFYKDQLFSNKNGVVNNGGFYPISEGEYNLIDAINDSTKQYYDVTQILFKKHLFEIEGDDFFIEISPIIDFSLGRDLNDTSDRKLFQNTRGAIINVDLFKNFSFSTALFENQSRFSSYENRRYIGAGELYPKAPSGYQNNADNAVIPGAARTKPFKEDGFDYAYAIGHLSYLPHKSLRISAGNNQQFVGDGHRSILLSDNTVGSPYFRVDWNISPKFKMTYHRARMLNLLRRSISSSAEVYYETKGYSVNYFSYLPTENISVSLFEGSIWNRGDSLTSKFSHPLYYNPVPTISTFILNGKNEVSTLLGINTSATIGLKHRVYGQLAINNMNIELFAAQLGYRGYDYFGLDDFLLQIEWNHLPPGFYNNSNSRMNYVNNNLPLGHVKGDGFDEALFRLTYMYKRFYLEQSTSIYFLYAYNEASLLPITQTLESSNYTIVNSRTELGYRFNKKMNLTFYGALQYRSEKVFTDNALIYIGLRTSIINHYNDF